MSSSTAPAADSGIKGKLVVRNIGTLLSGALDRPVLDADTIVAAGRPDHRRRQGRTISTREAPTSWSTPRAPTVAPGLIDSHVHPVFGDWTPRQSQLGWIDSFLNGGVTTMISAGEVHLPGRPRDVLGVKALAITAQRAFASFRPGGVKLHAGAPVLEQGMVEGDFKELAAAGVTLLGEVGLGGVKEADEAKRMVAWARKYGIQSTIHTGGPSIPGSGLIDADVVLEADADVIGHINGGHTALPDPADPSAFASSARARSSSSTTATRWPRCWRCARRTSSSSPSASSSAPIRPRAPACSRWESCARSRCSASLGEIDAATAFCFATGNTARIHELDCGLIEPGRAADLVIMDRAQHTAGRTCSRACVSATCPASAW